MTSNAVAAVGHDKRGLRAQLTDFEHEFYTRREAARLLRTSVTTLERWGRQGFGPRFALVGGKALYERTELMRFAREGR
jgi:hypothetical protein